MSGVEARVRQAMEQAVSAAPAYAGTYDEVIRAGRARRRRSLMLVAGGAVSAVVAPAVWVAVSIGGHPGTSEPVVPVSAPPGTQPADRLPARGEAAVIARAVRNHSPGAFRLFLYGGPGVAGEIGVDGWADDGHGRSRVSVVRETAPGAIEADPCRDSGFVAGGTCRAVRLQDGSTLFVRGEAGTTYQTVLAVLRHPDGTGVSAESDNGWFRRPGARHPQFGREIVTRVHPIYKATQLAVIVRAVDAALNRHSP
jgi:hypothetical protein